MLCKTAASFSTRVAVAAAVVVDVVVDIDGVVSDDGVVSVVFFVSVVSVVSVVSSTVGLMEINLTSKTTCTDAGTPHFGSPTSPNANAGVKTHMACSPIFICIIDRSRPRVMVPCPNIN